MKDITTHTNEQIKHSVPDATLRSGPETVLWGYIAANLPPALSIKSGAVVEVEALSHQGLTTQKDPEKFSPATVYQAGKFCLTQRRSSLV
jgi:hypothetical protein